MQETLNIFKDLSNTDNLLSLSYLNNIHMQTPFTAHRKIYYDAASILLSC